MPRTIIPLVEKRAMLLNPTVMCVSVLRMCTWMEPRVLGMLGKGSILAPKTCFKSGFIEM